MGIEISKRATIGVDADRLWSILADEFDRVGEWARAVDHSAANPTAVAPEGANVGGRVCQAPGFGAIDATFVSFDPEMRSYAFRASASKIPSFVENITNHTSVRPVGPDRSEVIVKITADANGIRGALVKPMMERKFSAAIDGLIEDPDLVKRPDTENDLVELLVVIDRIGVIPVSARTTGDEIDIDQIEEGQSVDITKDSNRVWSPTCLANS